MKKHNKTCGCDNKKYPKIYSRENKSLEVCPKCKGSRRRYKILYFEAYRKAELLEKRFGGIHHIAMRMQLDLSYFGKILTDKVRSLPDDLKKIYIDAYEWDAIACFLSVTTSTNQGNVLYFDFPTELEFNGVTIIKKDTEQKTELL